MEEKDEIPIGIPLELLKEYLGASSRRLELEFEKSQELFNLSTEKFEREREKSQKQLNESSERFIRRMEEGREHLRLTADIFLQRMFKSHEDFKSSAYRYGREDDDSLEGAQGQKTAKGRLKGKPGKGLVKLATIFKSFELCEKFADMGLYFTEQSFNKHIIDRGSPDKITEIDIILENDDLVAAVELKSKPTIEDIDEHAERVEALRRIAFRRNDSREFRGAFSGTMSRQVREYAEGKGFYVFG